jgi:tRNA threonylcarbamoyladenosine biosynthesis protein TsaB
MTYLILDTSTDLCLIALAKGDQIVAEEIFPHGNLLSNRLIPTIQSFVATHCKSPKNLAGIALGIGPGSYTGTRVGAAVAKSLAFGLEIPLKTFHSPLAFLPDKEGSFAFIIPTRSGQFYLLSGRLASTHVDQENSSLFSAEEIEKFENVDFLICASIDSLPLTLRGKTHFPPIPNFRPLAYFLSNQSPSLLENTELLYLNHPSAQGTGH